MSGQLYSTITVSGAGAFEFLQNQLAADLNRLRDDTPNLSAWCNPKGRVICLFRVASTGSGYTLTLPTGLVEDVVKRLTMFRFRAEVEFDARPSTPEELGLTGSLEDWQIDKLRAGIVEIDNAQSEQFTPHMLNLDLLGAVSLDKGCYPGQEIVARTHYRGATKRRTHRFESGEPVSPGDRISDGERDVGEVLNAIGTDLLAVVPTEKAEQDLRVGNTRLKHIPLPYL